MFNRLWVRYGIGLSVIWLLFVFMGEDTRLAYMYEVHENGENLLITYLLGFAVAFILSWAFVKKNKD